MPTIENLARSVKLIGITLAGSIPSMYFIYEYNKFSADWWGMSIWIYALIASAILFGVLTTKFKWWNSFKGTTSWKMAWTPTIGMLLCVFMGIYFTEPNEPEWNEGDTTTYNQEESYGHSRSGGYFYSSH